MNLKSNSANVVVSGGTDGTDTLINIERLQFSDSVVALDIQGTAGQTYRLYQAAFHRTPDTPGLSSNVHLIDQGLTLHQMSAAFAVSAEFKDLYGQNPTDTQFVTALYQNVLNRGPDSAGLAGWLGFLSSGQKDRADVLIGFSESPENHGRVDSAVSITGIILDQHAFLA